jgi:hypothetical protein
VIQYCRGGTLSPSGFRLLNNEEKRVSRYERL